MTEVRKNYPGLTVTTAPSGAKRIRVRVEGDRNKKITLKVTLDHPKFSEHYTAARAGIAMAAEPETTAVKHSLGWMVELYLRHLEALAESGTGSELTFKQRRNLLTRLCKHPTPRPDGTITTYGAKSIQAPASAFVALRDDMSATSAEADNMIKAIRSMYAWAMKGNAIVSQMVKVNPLHGIEKIHVSRGGAVPWTSADLIKFKERHPPGTMAHLALTIHMFTAARRSDAYLFGRGHEVERDGIRWLCWQPAKKGSAAVELPMMPPLIEATRASKVIGKTYLLNAHGQPFNSAASYGGWFRKRISEAGLKGRSSHGVRKAMAELLAESGCGENQISAVLSHTKPGTSAIYTRKANRRKMAADAMKAAGSISW